MSRIGMRTLQIPPGVKIREDVDCIVVDGPKGNVKIPFKKSKTAITLSLDNNRVLVRRNNDEKTSKMMHGTLNALIANAIHGVTQLWSAKLNLVGVGYRASVSDNTLTLGLGYSHPIKIKIPQAVSVTCPTQTEINISCADRSVVGQFASEIRRWRMPEPYKGKGVLFAGERIVRKVGKTAEGSKK